EVTGYVDGIAASAASYLLTFARRVVMPSNTFQMLHGVRSGIVGTAPEVEAHGRMMARLNEQIAEAYAAASARRGKSKTKEDFLALFAKGATYFDADEAIEWGLADEKLEPLQVAACLVDLGEYAVSAPAELRSASYVAKSPPARVEPIAASAASQPITPPSPGARADEPRTNPTTGEEKTKMKSVIQALALDESADEAVVLAAVKK